MRAAHWELELLRRKGLERESLVSQEDSRVSEQRLHETTSELQRLREEGAMLRRQLEQQQKERLEFNETLASAQKWADRVRSDSMAWQELLKAKDAELERLRAALVH
mmetsp:Transcript_56244/g.122253  ORF Transcript_56244/g.122253 Transcript_56244/m.122253 type:complete len:107 (-) Transcript_56244:370-690(-)